MSANGAMTHRTIQTKAYGEIEIEEQQVLEFPVGLYGFEHHHSYALVDSASPPFYWLQSLDDVSVAFVVVNPYMVIPGYILDVDEHDLVALGNPPADDLLVFATVTVPEDRTRISCNLQGPIIVDRRRRVARQAISVDPRWKLKHYLLSGVED